MGLTKNSVSGYWRAFYGMLMPLACVVLFAQASAAQQGSQLHRLYEAGYMLVDSDGDSLSDVVRGRLVLPDAPKEEQIITAANVAARLGYETTAMDLDLGCRLSRCADLEDRPAVLVGDARDFGLEPGRENRSPGEGSLRWVTNSRFPRGAVLVSGYDATGLLEAGYYLSARYPSLAGPSGDGWRELADRIEELSAADSADGARVALLSLTVAGGKEGIRRARIRLDAPDGAAYGRLADSLAASPSTWRESIGEMGLYGLALELSHGDSLRRFHLSAPQAQPTSDSAEPQAGRDSDFDLQDFYTPGGIYRDTNDDRVPDDMGAYISYSGNENMREVVKLAARMGLETAGIRLPLVYPGGGEEHPEKRGFPVVVGSGSPSVEKAGEEGRLLNSEPAPGEGYVEFLKGVFGERNGVILYGGDSQGTGAASGYLAERLPYLWKYGKGERTLDEIQTEVRRFLQGVGGAGQAAAGVEKLRTWLDRLGDTDPEELSVRLSAETSPPGLDGFLEEMLAERFPSAELQVETRSTGFGVGDTVFAEEFEIPWEVDAFWKLFEDQIEPALEPGSEGRIELRVSESPEIRSAIRRDLHNRLEQLGIGEGQISVSVLSAYKQGFSWIEDEILPRLKGRDVASVRIRYRHLRDASEIRWQAAASPTRWLQEVYPIDGVLSRELDLADSSIVFEPVYEREEPTYALQARDGSGEIVLEERFNARYVVRPYFDLFPAYDSVRVTTGWAEARIDGETVADRRIRTDLETFWDHLQGTTYPRLAEYVMDIQEGRPEEELAPFFDEFRLDVTLSEPDYQLGFLREQISSTEALHEDIYFETLLLFDLLGNRYGAGGLDYPGRILPFIRPPEPGKAGRARITLTGKREARPLLVLRYREEGGQVREMRYELPNTPVEDPSLRAVKVESGSDGVAGLYFEVPVDTLADPYQGLRERASERSIDRSFVSAERLGGMIRALGDFHGAGLFEQVLSYDRVGEIGFRFAKDDSLLRPDPLILTRSGNPASTDPPPLPDVGGFDYGGEELVQWQDPISPVENNRIMARLNTFDNVGVYHKATSLLGREVYVMDLLPPTPSAYRSQAKMNALKPTLFISGRQHANEFSSTSHMLRLAEKVATDSTYRKYLRRVNLVLHPVTNPDGAALSIELNELNPYHMNHAAYLGPLGVDITRDQNDRDPRYEVAKVRREIHDTWLPDIYINMHGYPPHEWVQYFAGYSAWMTSRDRGPSSNNYWIPRGYFLTGFSWYDHEDHPFNKELSFALLDSISTHVNGVPAMRRVNEEMQRRYRKYRSQEDAYGEFYRNGLWVNAPLTGREFTGSGFSDPDITYFTLTSEAPDEPAQGDWLEMNAAAGLAHSTAVLNYLYYGMSDETRKASLKSGRIHRARYRVKPVLPPRLYELKKEKEKN